MEKLEKQIRELKIQLVAQKTFIQAMQGSIFGLAQIQGEDISKIIYSSQQLLIGTIANANLKGTDISQSEIDDALKQILANVPFRDMNPN